MTSIQSFLLFVLWIPPVVSFFIMIAKADDSWHRDENKGVIVQLAVLFGVQLILAILASVFKLLLLMMAIVNVVMMIIAIVMCVKGSFDFRSISNCFSRFFSAQKTELERGSSDKPKKNRKKFWLWFGIIVALIAFLYGILFVLEHSKERVFPGERAVLMVFGKIVPKSFGPGLVWFIPFSKDWGNEVLKVSTRPRNYAYNLPVRTKETQRISIDCSVLVQIVPDSVHVMCDKYIGYDDYETKIIRDMVQSTMLALSSQMSFWSFAGNEVNLITEATQYIVNDKLMAENLVKIEKIWLNDYNASKEMERLIEQTMQAKQRVDLEQFKLEQAKIQTEQVKLQAIQRYEMLAAEAKAKGIETQIEADAARNNPYIALYRLAKAWKGDVSLPQTLMFMNGEGKGSGASVLPIIPINK